MSGVLWKHTGRHKPPGTIGTYCVEVCTPGCPQTLVNTTKRCATAGLKATHEAYGGVVRKDGTDTSQAAVSNIFFRMTLEDLGPTLQHLSPNKGKRPLGERGKHLKSVVTL